MAESEADVNPNDTPWRALATADAGGANHGVTSSVVPMSAAAAPA